MPCRPVLRDVRRTARAVTAGRRAEWRRQTSLVLLSLLRAKSLPGSAPKARGRAVARDHALLSDAPIDTPSQAGSNKTHRRPA